ncbi:hypothetical protein F5I97DRAFT_651829 [Phlebopus sp. FC_14]|nr:hypothetical protein F5I97DRAFT_651829 [Phlebopus sp. FC_14]
MFFYILEWAVLFGACVLFFFLLESDPCTAVFFAWTFVLLIFLVGLNGTYDLELQTRIDYVHGGVEDVRSLWAMQTRVDPSKQSVVAVVDKLSGTITSERTTLRQLVALKAYETSCVPFHPFDVSEKFTENHVRPSPHTALS